MAKRNSASVSIIFVFCACVSIAFAVPGMINYQGKIEVSGEPFSGDGQFKFALVTEAGAYLWSNDGNFPPTSSFAVNGIVDGLYDVILGESPMVPIAASVFDSEEIYIRIWFSDGSHGEQLLQPDQKVVSVGYSMKAQDANTLSGHAATDFAMVGNLDADTLDGIDSEQFLRSDEDDETSGNLFVGGSIGIGTTNPQNKLHIVGGSEMALARIETISDDRNPVLGLKDNSPSQTRDGGINFIKNDGLTYGQLGYVFPENKMVLKTNRTNRLAITGEGKVGIGTDAPEGALHVKTDLSDYGMLRLQRASGNGEASIGYFGRADGSNNWTAGVGCWGNTDSFVIGGGGGEARMVIKNGTGYIGIGTTNPQDLLDVNGTMKVRTIASPQDANLTLNLRSNIHNKFVVRDGWQGRDVFYVHGDQGNVYTYGSIGVKTQNPGYDLDVNGVIRATDNYVCPSADIAEKLPTHPDFELSKEEIIDRLEGQQLSEQRKKEIIEGKEISLLEPGTVVVITEKGVVPCSEENDTRLAGIISTQPAVKMASTEKGQYIALAGKVPCKVTGKIHAGDLLTTSSIEGHAEAALDPKIGAVVGKALQSFDGSSGSILVWVSK